MAAQSQKEFYTTQEHRLTSLHAFLDVNSLALSESVSVANPLDGHRNCLTRASKCAMKSEREPDQHGATADGPQMEEGRPTTTARKATQTARQAREFVLCRPNLQLCCVLWEHFARCVFEIGVKILPPVFVAWVADAIKQIEKEIHFSVGWGSIMPAGSRTCGRGAGTTQAFLDGHTEGFSACHTTHATTTTTPHNHSHSQQHTTTHNTRQNRKTTGHRCCL